MSITPVYAGILTLLYLVLSFRIIGMRRSQGIGLGDGGNKDMLRRIRAHGNFAEYVPLALILMAFVELQNKTLWLVHLIGALLLIGRFIHAIGVSFGLVMPRVIGMILTFAALITGALTNMGLDLLTAVFAVR